ISAAPPARTVWAGHGFRDCEKTQDECDFGWRSASSVAISSLLWSAVLAAEVNCQLPEKFFRTLLKPYRKDTKTIVAFAPQGHRRFRHSPCPKLAYVRAGRWPRLIGFHSC